MHEHAPPSGETSLAQEPWARLLDALKPGPAKDLVRDMLTGRRRNPYPRYRSPRWSPESLALARRESRGRLDGYHDDDGI